MLRCHARRRPPARATASDTDDPAQVNVPIAPRGSTAAAPAAVLMLGYGVLYCMLDWISYVQPLGGTDLTAWNPQWALAVAVMARAPSMGWPLVVTLVAA